MDDLVNIVLVESMQHRLLGIRNNSFFSVDHCLKLYLWIIYT